MKLADHNGLAAPLEWSSPCPPSWIRVASDTVHCRKNIGTCG